MQIVTVIFSVLIMPVVASAQNTDIAPISVCVDAKKSSSCLTGDTTIRTLYGKGLVRASLGWKVRNDLFVNPVLGKLVQYGENFNALFIVEEVTPDSENNRPDGHPSVPNMAIALFSWTDGAWKLLSHAKGLDGVGALGFLNVDRLIVHIAGYQQYFIEIPSGYTTSTGPSSQRSRQPALLILILPGPFMFNVFKRFFAYSCKACALRSAQQARPSLRSLIQKKT